MTARWYIIQAYSGFEKKVAQAILTDAAEHGLADKIEDVVVPTEEITEVRRGKKVKSERKFFPGYVMVKMEMTEATWQFVKNIPKVTGFLGANKGNKPQPISEHEAQNIFKQLQDGADQASSGIIFEVGEQVKVVDGPFESFVGIIDEVDSEKERVKVSVAIFGRPTPVELQFAQIEKIEAKE